MKRRDFLSASAGLTATMLPAWASGEERPCPPPSIAVTGGESVEVQCQSSQPGDAPRWFLEMPERTWTCVAGGIPGAAGSKWSGAEWQQGARLRDVAPVNPYIGGQGGITSAFTGGCVDQRRGELILAANGGHSDYFGNEVYALALRADMPSWLRLTDPTPNTYLSTKVDGPDQLANTATEQGRALALGSNLDWKIPAGSFLTRDGLNYGNPVALHGWDKCEFGGGKVWYLGLPGSASPGGSRGTSAQWSFDRDAAAAYGSYPIPHTDAPWKCWGHCYPTKTYGDGELGRFVDGPACYADGKIWSLPGGTGWALPGVPGQYTGVYSADVTTGAVTRYGRGPEQANAAFGGSWCRDSAPGIGGQTPIGDQSFGNMWMVACPDLRVMVAAQWYSRNIWVIPLDGGEHYMYRKLPIFQSGAEFPLPNSWAGNTTLDYLGRVNPPGYGAVYHAPSRSILTWEVRSSVGMTDTRKVRRLRLPATPLTAAQEGGGFEWSLVNPAASNAVTPTYVGNEPSGMYGKFNIIENMGNGQSALVAATDTLSPVYVYKLPVAGV